MARFDATAYRNDVLKPNSRGEAYEQLREVVAELTRDVDSKAYARLDLNALYAIPSPVTAAELTEWKSRVVPALNKAEQSLPSARLLKTLLETLEKGVDLTAPAFWGGLQAERQKLIVGKLDSGIQQLKGEYPLGVISLQELTARLASIGINGVTEGSIQSVAAKQGFEVVAELVFPADGIPSSIRPIWKQVSQHTEFRSILDVLLVHRGDGVTSVRFIDSLEADGSPVTTSDINRARAKSEQGQDTDALQSAQKFLGALKDRCGDDEALRNIVFATAAEFAANQLGRGKPKVMVRDELVAVGFEITDSSRLVAALSASQHSPGKTMGLDTVREKLAQGLLDDADRVLAAVGSTDDNASDHAALTAQLVQLKQKKKQFLDAHHVANAARDFSAAAQAVRDAMALDSGDDALEALMAALPPSAPRSLAARVDGSSVVLSWAQNSEPMINYTVVRCENRVPTSPTDGVAIVKASSVSSTSDTAVTSAARFGYAVFGSRDGRVFSDPAVTEITVLLAPSNVSATATATSVELSWVQPPGAVGTVITQLDPNNRSVQHELARGTSFRADGLTSGSKYYFSVQAVHYIDAGRQLSERVPIVAVPRGRASAVHDLQVSNVETDGRNLLQARWTRIDGFDVEMWALPRNVDLPVGSTVTTDALSRAGGLRVPSSGANPVTAAGQLEQMSFEVPTEISRIVPLTVNDAAYLVGTSVLAGSAAQATGIVAEFFGTELRVSWNWPSGDSLMELRWTQAGREFSRRVTRARYRADSGAKFTNANVLSDLTIATVVRVGGDEWTSPAVPVPLAVGGTAVITLQYSMQIKRARLGNKISCVVTIDSNTTGVILPVSVVVKSGSIMPFGSDDGQRIAELSLNFTVDSTVSHELSLGKQPSPIWLRLFAEDGTTQLIDPPTSQLKG
jgi:hypothetical protein